VTKVYYDCVLEEEVNRAYYLKNPDTSYQFDSREECSFWSQCQKAGLVMNRNSGKYPLRSYQLEGCSAFHLVYAPDFYMPLVGEYVEYKGSYIFTGRYRDTLLLNKIKWSQFEENHILHRVVSDSGYKAFESHAKAIGCTPVSRFINEQVARSASQFSR
jgi:hypothetical protein